ncbi:MAG: pyridoxamine 5'-phosphate oxidase family protein [Acidimicrobiia bacterium]|nr:pyridoxamine 5'-phosphate oxidase family protein [Acidimicrobiia bacterium]
MPRMADSEIVEYLARPHVGVLSVSRRGRGPVAVPLWYDYSDGHFWLITARESLHGRIIRQVGRATLTFHSEDYGEFRTVEEYVMAEGPVEFVGDDIRPVIHRIRSRYYTGPRATEWVNRPLVPETLNQRLAVLSPETLSGYRWEESL